MVEHYSCDRDGLFDWLKFYGTQIFNYLDASRRPLLTIPPIPGSQGHYPLPEIGDKVKVFLIKEANGKYSALLPNGFSIIS